MWTPVTRQEGYCPSKVMCSGVSRMRHVRPLVLGLFRPPLLRPEPEGFRYRAFLSYRTLDRKQAERLHRKLERYRVPRSLLGRRGELGVVPARVGRIFLDRE